MTLLAHAIRLRHPCPELIIDVTRVADAEAVDMIARGEGFHLPEARAFQAPRQHDMAVEPSLARRHLREGHPHLKSNPRLLGNHSDRTDAPNGRDDRVEQRTNLRRLSIEVT